ncbi:MAG: type I-E CRISPR-associated protein Cas7/Cse4/CasC [Bryobacterales bacterium]|nr:type I-E CRISPR-associated protein Cas7/Cse4/CasC [Bryobacterales bacterium]
MFIELHLIQNFAPANLNRDDTGSPKDAIFGGHRRARISSQAFKAAIRRQPVFTEKTAVPMGQRTKRMAGEIASRLEKKGRNIEDADKVAIEFSKAYAGKLDSKQPSKTSVLIYLSESEIDWIAEHLDKNWDVALREATGKDSKEQIIGDLVKQLIKQTGKRTSAPDIALFGRMLADKPETNIDAACQVAHALSTQVVRMEMDYYTAMDHLKPDDTAGADMVGFTSFNSACYYRYMRIDWRQLMENLKDVELAKRTVEGFLRSAMVAIPTGKQNAFSAQNSTNLALALARNDGKSWNLVNAFETPVRPAREAETGYIDPSIRALDAYWYDLASFYDDSRLEAAAVYVMEKHAEALNHLAQYRKEKFSDWVNTIIDALPEE